MPIFDMYGGRPDLYTADETDRLNNPEKYNYTQAQYDALVAGIESRVKSRQAVDQRGREAVLTSYANFGTGGTNPGFSLAGRSGHTSGGLAGNAGTAEYAGPAEYAEGGMVPDVQYMQLGGMASPYADPISKPQMMGQQTLAPMGGVGGLFQDMNRNQMEQNRNQMGMMQAQMGGAPLEVYGNYLNNVYTAQQAESSQAQVAEFIDMVDRAERAHFGAEESFGYGGGAYQQGLMSQYQNLPAPTNMMDNQQYRGGPSGLEQSAGFSQLPQMSSGLPQVY